MVRLVLRAQAECGQWTYCQCSLLSRYNLKIIYTKDFVSRRQIVIYSQRREITIQQTGDIPHETRQSSIAIVKGLVWISPWVIIENTERNWIQ